ncbi:sensor histidine kinase [Actinomadura algeriensis]|uniref:Two-component system sensor histidine kinase DesK n=1 Tax=Actinomadura algeriensis TaxID=1679523 RepID=A0ABR9JXZ2_9ACTN|nr:sensor histidine kinase [Actinomadura algeriensis]MBE1535259.1 two-component system sensor histidine kinase DesK [Actinomadura algeriensis]
MAVATTAELEEQNARRLERYRKVTQRSFMMAGIVFVAIGLGALGPSYSEGEIGVPVAALAALGLALLLWFYIRLVRTGLDGGAARRDIVLSGALSAALGPMMLTNPVWCVIPVFWTSAVVLSPVSRNQIAALCAGTGAFCAVFATVTAWRNAEDGHLHWYLAFPFFFVVFFLTCALVAWVNRYQRRMWDMHLEAYAARDAVARLAVTEERLRFSRDLHDLLGHSLSLIAVKSELAMRMAETDPARAGAEMADVRTAAREALREVRAAVRGYRAVELDAELAGVRAVLEAAGVRCEADEPPAGLPSEVGAVLAWVIREGATNVIKHSEARRCSVAVTVYGRSVVLEMRNDGVRARGAEPAGSGLTGLEERVAVLGGEITAGRHGRDGFLLRAVVPLPAGDDAAGPADETVPAGGRER